MIPMTPTDYYRIHVDEVDALCYADAPIPEQYPYIPPTEDEKMIASHIVDRIPDGATIQIGVGTVPAAVCNCLTGKKHLGVHSEVITESITELMRLGVVDNSRKSLYPGLSIAGFAGGTRRTLDYIHKNDKILLRSLAWVNNPAVIAQNNNMISVNSCLGVDLTGQVCAESIGQGRSGGTGGQVDFVRGSQMAKGGMSFIAMHAVAKKKDGTLVSKITLDLPFGSIVTTLRNDVQYIVTEYGIADLKYKSEAQRAEALIAIAHPDFRDELAFQARKANLIF